MADTEGEIMQSTTCLHDGIANPVFEEAYLIFDQTVAFHPANGVFDSDTDGGNRTIGGFFRWGEFPSERLFLGLEDRDLLTRIALEAHVLIETTPGREGRALPIREALIIGLPFRGGTQATHVAGLIDPEEVFDRLAFLLAAVVVRVNLD